MRIVIATAVYYPQVNGVAVFSHNLALGLVRRGHEVMVICPSQTGKAHVEVIDGVRTVYLKSVDLKLYPDQIHEVPTKRKLWYKHGFRASVFPKRAVAKVLGEFHPDVVHVQVSDLIGLSVVGWARRHKVPVVITEHNQPEVITDSLKIGILKKPANSMLLSYFRNRQSKCDFITMPTEQAIRNLLKKQDLLVPVAAISNGVDLSAFRSGKVSSDLYKEYGLDSNKKTVLYVGRLDPEKRVGLVIEAFLEAKVEDVQMVIVGDGVDKARLVQQFGKCKNVFFLGRIMPPKLYEVYRLGDVFATASEIETQGIVLIEAAATGLPLIAVDAGAVSEVCKNGENGFLCPPRSLSKLSESIKTILEDDKMRKRFSSASEKIAHEHDFEKTLDKFINVYNRVIKDK